MGRGDAPGCSECWRARRRTGRSPCRAVASRSGTSPTTGAPTWPARATSSSRRVHPCSPTTRAPRLRPLPRDRRGRTRPLGRRSRRHSPFPPTRGLRTRTARAAATRAPQGRASSSCHRTARCTRGESTWARPRTTWPSSPPSCVPSSGSRRRRGRSWCTRTASTPSGSCKKAGKRRPTESSWPAPKRWSRSGARGWRTCRGTAACR